MTRGTVGRVGDAGEREGSVRRRGERGDPRPSRRSRSGAWGAAAGRGAVLGGLAGIAASLAFTAYYIVRRHYLPGDIPFIGLHLLTYPLWRVAPVAMVCGASVGVVLRAAGPWRRPVASACFAAAAAGAAFVVARRYGVPLPPTIRLPVTGFAAAVGIIAGAPFLLLFARIDRAVAAVRWNAVGLAVAGPLAVLSLIALAGHPTTRLVPHQRFSEERFLELFDRHAPGMEEVFRLAGRGDRAGAIHALAEHFRTRPVPPMRPGIEVGPATDAQLEIADAALAHRYRMTGFERQEGKKIDWTGSQVQDAEWAYTLNRHTQWVEMARAWRRTGDPKYVREVVTLLHDWTARTEPLRWKNELSPHWRLVESGLRMRNAWMQTSEALRDRPELDDRFWVDYLGSVHDQAQFLAHFRGDANHLLIEINGLLETALHYPEFRRSGKWLDIALGRLQQQVRAQVYDDGVNVELSPAYHRLVLEELMLARAAILSHGMMLPGDLDERIEAMWEYLASVVQPDGIVPSLNDGAVAKVDDDLVRVGGLFDRPDFIYAGTAGREGTRPRWSSRCFPQAGQIVMRTGWTPEDLELTFDAGAFGGPHGHEDKLSVTCWGYGRPLIVDNGSYTYDPANRFHRYFRATAGHNSVLVDGCGQSRSRYRRSFRFEADPPPFWAEGECGEYAEGIYDEGYLSPKGWRLPLDRSVRHVRAVLFVRPEYWIVLDRLEGRAGSGDGAGHAAAGRRALTRIFHLSPGRSQVAPDGAWAATDSGGAGNLLIVPGAQSRLRIVEGSEDPIQGWTAAGYNAKRPAPAVLIDSDAAVPEAIATLLIPFRPEERQGTANAETTAAPSAARFPGWVPPWIPEVKESPIEGGGLALEIRLPDEEDVVVWPAPPRAKAGWSWGDFRGDPGVRLVMMRRVADGTTRFFKAGEGSATWRGQAL